jgi:hypothetical protein
MKQEIKTETVVFELPLVMIGEKDLCMAKSWPEQPGFYIGKSPIGEYCICEKQEGVDTVNFSWLPLQFVEVINSSITEARLVDRIQKDIKHILDDNKKCVHDAVNDAKESISKLIECVSETNNIGYDLIRKKLSDIEEKVNSESDDKGNTAKGGVSEQCLLNIIRTVTK